MSSSCHIYLSNETRLHDVLDVMAILLGHKKEMKPLSRDGQYCVVGSVSSVYPSKDSKNNIKALATHDPSMVLITIEKNNIDRQGHNGYWFYETENNMRLLSGGDSEFWHKIGYELVKFFGGYVDYNDCDSVQKDAEFDRPRESNNPNDGQEWDDFETEKFNVKSFKK